MAFVAGTLIFTNAMGGAFDDIIEGSTADVEVAFKGANDFDSGQDNRTFPASVVSDLEALPEVGSAHPQNTLQTVFVIGKNGKVIGGNGPPGLAINQTGAKSLTGTSRSSASSTGSYPPGRPDRARRGHRRQGRVRDRRHGRAGDARRPPVMKTRLTGLVEFGLGRPERRDDDRSSTRSSCRTASSVGRTSSPRVSLNAAPGVSQTELAKAAQKVLPEGVVARTGDAVVKTNKGEPRPGPRLPQTFLLVFAAVSLVVGIFLIINTFSILVAQRSRELALLRALGASRRQVNRSVLARGGRSSGWSGRRSAWGWATCSRSDCAGCSGCSGSTSAGPTSR